MRASVCSRILYPIFFITKIGLTAKSFPAKCLQNLLRVSMLFISNRHDHGLNRRQPGGQFTSVVFKKNTGKTLKRAEERPV